MNNTDPRTPPIRRSPRFRPGHERIFGAVAPPAPAGQRTYSRRRRRGPATTTVHISSSGSSGSSDDGDNDDDDGSFIARTLGRSPFMGYARVPAWVRNIPSDDDFSDVDDDGDGPPTEIPPPPRTVLTRLSTAVSSMPTDYALAASSSSSSSSSGDGDVDVPDIPASLLTFSDGEGVSTIESDDDDDPHHFFYISSAIVPLQDHDPTTELGGVWGQVGPGRWRLRGPLSDVEVHAIQTRLIGLHEPEVDADVAENGGGGGDIARPATRVRRDRTESEAGGSAADDATTEVPVCCICREDGVKTVFVNCGHACLCLACDEELYTKKLGESQCPICTKPGESVELFFS